MFSIVLLFSLIALAMGCLVLLKAKKICAKRSQILYLERLFYCTRVVDYIFLLTISRISYV